MFVPRTHENGGICCSAPGAMCDKCKIHHARTSPRTTDERRADLKAAEAPDPYAIAVAKLHALAPYDAPFEITPDLGIDGYRIAATLARARQDMRDDVDSRQAEIVYDAHGIPDPYASGMPQTPKETHR